MKALCKRLSSKRGESLVESLVSILVLTFTSLLFIAMVMSAKNINKTVNDSDKNFQKAKERLEQKKDLTPSDKNLVISYGEDAEHVNTTLATIPVEFYQDGDDGMFAFYLPTEADAP